MSKNPLSILLLHGFSTHRSSLEALLPGLDQRHLPWHYPILAGHGTTPHDLADKTWEHWLADAQAGLHVAANQGQQVVIIALSMGSLLALELAATHPDTVAGLVLLSPCLHFNIPFARLTPHFAKVIPRVPFFKTTKYSSRAFAKKDQGYPWVPTKSFHRYWQRTQNFDDVLKQVRQPLLIIHSPKDKIAAPSGAQHIYDTVPSKDKRIIWINKSGHEILLDCETERVVRDVFGFRLFKELKS